MAELIFLDQSNELRDSMWSNLDKADVKPCLLGEPRKEHLFASWWWMVTAAGAGVPSKRVSRRGRELMMGIKGGWGRQGAVRHWVTLGKQWVQPCIFLDFQDT